jgi:chorismate dehydratase
MSNRVCYKTCVSRLRVAAISYLNTAPLMWDFDWGELRKKYEVAYTLPSACAEMLRAGTADGGTIPAATYATIPDLTIVPDVAIATRGPVASIYLASKVPLDQIKTIAADTSSRSSVALLKVLMAKKWQHEPEFVPAEPKIDKMLKSADSALLIGDPALALGKKPPAGVQLYDLGEEWVNWIGKPFVFAFWAVRKAANPDAQVARDFQLSRDHGLESKSIAKIASEWRTRIGLSEDEIAQYFIRNIEYKLAPDCLDGLRLFYRYAEEIGALPTAPELDFLT